MSFTTFSWSWTDFIDSIDIGGTYIGSFIEVSSGVISYFNVYFLTL